MPKGYFIQNATLINEDRRYPGCIKITGDYIEEIFEKDFPSKESLNNYEIIDAKGKWVLPGFIDDQVHFREPGLTHKGDLYSEPKAAVAGGITSFMEMPNTVPGAVSKRLLADKYVIAAEKSIANFSFYMGATNNNLDQLLKVDPATVCGAKIFMGSSTGDMLVDNVNSLEDIFREVNMLIATHCEDDTVIAANAQEARNEFGENVPFRLHPYIRSEEACYRSTSKALELASKYNTRLHVLHISTARELELFRNDIPSEKKQITAEACVHHLWFSDVDYASKGCFIKWNPAIKTIEDRKALREAVINGKIDVLATDHAPHTLQEKRNSYFSCPSGGPLVQHALPALFELARNAVFSPELIVRKYAHAVADLFKIKKRGYLRKGYYADVVIINPEMPWTVKEENIFSKCGWSPFAGTTFQTSVEKTFVNGNLVYDNGRFYEQQTGMRLLFDR